MTDDLSEGVRLGRSGQTPVLTLEIQTSVLPNLGQRQMPVDSGGSLRGIGAHKARLPVSPLAAASADSLRAAGQVDAVRDLAHFGEAQRRSGARLLAAKLQRLRGRYADPESNRVLAETCCRQAIETAEHEGATMFTFASCHGSCSPSAK